MQVGDKQSALVHLRKKKELESELMIYIEEHPECAQYA
jgi:hypothetical protein